MKNLRLIRFTPSTGTAELYWQDGDFRDNSPLAIADLAPDWQAVVTAAMSWAVAQLPPEFAELRSVELKRVGDVVTSWSVPENEAQVPEPQAYSPAFVATIVGRGQAGGQAEREIRSTPGHETDGLAQLWNHLAQ